MRIINIHKRTIYQPKEKLSPLFKSLSSQNDLVWPYENWPAMRFKDGLKIGSKGGHGRIRYTIIEFVDDEYIKFQFSMPKGFNGVHELRIIGVSDSMTEIIHEIRAEITFKAIFLWVFVIRWLHDALIEDAFDKVENYFTETKKTTRYNLWVRFLREYYKKISFLTKQT